MSSDKNPPRRLTPPEAFPDLDAALAARGLALNAGAPRRRVNEPEERLTDAVQQPAGLNGGSSPHVGAFTGAVLGLVLIGLLVLSVIRVSGDSIRPAAPIANTPATSTAAPAPVAAVPPPAAIPPTPDSAPPELAAASQAAPPPTSASPTVPSAVVIASEMTAQTMIAKPPPPPESTPEDSLRSRLRERFEQLFPGP
ncbi:hypothetical protein [Mycobacterium sp. ITM-2016-00318]|uniref:hypothetical protein n=1 Tax=Mycobacterium sp. ITM-2016-00318 TaxID=2099693 RepID=UPI00115826FB|nr:hypothetical protein [Mycobacterium sp. ITM-2016-00318]WNG91296.1 hypothetical protein C6A82_017545 [Mycobacterium sp. ITM-2016-00318]